MRLLASTTRQVSLTEMAPPSRAPAVPADLEAELVLKETRPPTGRLQCRCPSAGSKWCCTGLFQAQYPEIKSRAQLHRSLCRPHVGGHMSACVGELQDSS